MLKQTTSCVVMVRPDYFGFNPQTAGTDLFQHEPQELGKTENEVRGLAMSEFENMVSVLRKNDIEVLVLPSRKGFVTPDAIFPNNWFSHHQEGQLVLYPMLATNRRHERQEKELLELLKTVGIKNPLLLDFTKDEEEGLILEATGSLVLDRVNKVAFAKESPRTTKKEFDKWCKAMHYEGFFIHTPNDKTDIYHTNLMMSIGNKFALVCLDAIDDVIEKDRLMKKLGEFGKEIISITIEQVYSYCGNILELESKKGAHKIIMSEAACKSFTVDQLRRIGQFGEIVSIEIPTIEKVGGGGTRCMIAEVFPSK